MAERERRKGVTIITNDTSRETGLGRTTYRTFDHLPTLCDFPVRLAVLDKKAKQVRVHEDGNVEEHQLVALPEHRYAFFYRATRHVPLGEINHCSNQVLSYLSVPNKMVTIFDLFFRTEDLSLAYKLHSRWLYPPMRNALHSFAISEESRREADLVLGIDPAKVTVIPLGVDAEKFRCELSPFEARRKLGLPTDAPILFHLSTETPRKNVPNCIRALARLRRTKEFAGAHLVKAGNATRFGDRRGNEDLTRELGVVGGVVWAGYVKEQDLALYYRAADLVLFPSFQEGFGLPVVEAFAAGVPCVTSNVSALPEVAGDAALMVDPRSPRAIADGCARVLADPSYARELVKRGNERAKLYTWEATAKIMAQTYGEVLERLRRT